MNARAIRYKPHLTAEKVKAAIPPLDFYRAELPGMPAPKRVESWADGGLCPFHPDRHTGNFRVNLDSGAFMCFACGTKGADLISFAQMRYGLSFRDALCALAREWDIR